MGYTTDLHRRLRQHNGEMAGGAKSTKGACWEYLFYLMGFPNKQTALSCEKHFHLLKTQNRPSLPWISGGGDIIPSMLKLTLHCDPRSRFPRANPDRKYMRA